jgi:hypothetical protein
MSCYALSQFWHFIFVAAYLDNTLSHRYTDGNRSSFFIATIEMCRNSFFRPAQKLFRVTFVMYLSYLCLLKCQLTPHILSLLCEGEHKWVCNHWKSSATGGKYSFTVTYRSHTSSLIWLLSSFKKSISENSLWIFLILILHNYILHMMDSVFHLLR